MTLVKTSALNAIAVVVRILTAIGLNKVLALYVGPAGYALVGQFANALTIAGSMAGGAVGNGITKYTAEYDGSREKQRLIWRTATKYLFASVSLTALFALLFSRQLALWLLGDSAYQPVFLCCALGLPLLAFNALLLAIMNGNKEVRALVAQSIASSLVSGMATAALAMSFGIAGALYGLVVGPAVGLLFTLCLCRRATWFTLDSFIGPASAAQARQLAGYAAMALTSAIVAPLGQLTVRDHLIDRFGQIAAGEWQAVFKMSEIYLQLFTATLGIYFLPRLSEIRDPRLLWLEITKVCRFMLPLALLAALALYWLREWVTVTVFTERFLGMVDLFRWQLVGDVLKLGGWIFGYVMVGRAMVGWFMATEIVFTLSWVVLALALTRVLGREGATAAFAINYGCYWLFMVALIRREMAGMR